jgi:hypothetical protein
MGYEFDGVVTQHGEERAIGYQPVLAIPAGGGGAPSDGVWLTGMVAVAGTILPGPGNYTAGQRAAEPPAWPRWSWAGLIVWLISLGAAVGFTVAALLLR